MANPTTNYGWPMPTSTDLVTDLPADFAAFGQPVDTTLKALNPETTLGDISYRSATSNTNTRLGIGTNGQVLAVSGGVPAWTTTSDVTPLTTKGDLFTFDTADARLAVGTNGQTLVADSSTATGLKWATPAASASGMTFITSSTFSSVASVSIDGCFTSTYDQYYITFTDTFAATSADDVYFQFRYSGPTTQAAGYYGSWWYFPTSGASLLSGQYRNTAQATLGTISGSSTAKSYGTMQIGGAGAASLYTMFNGTYGSLDQETMNWFGGGNGTDSRTYTGFLFKSSSSNVTGTIRVYGLAKS